MSGPATAVRDAIVDRAPERMIAGGRAALAALIDDILDAWIDDCRRAGGGRQRVCLRPEEEPASAPAHAARTGDRQSRRNLTGASWPAVLCATWSPTSP